MQPQLLQLCDPTAKDVDQLLMHYYIMYDMVWSQRSQNSNLWNKSSFQTVFVWLSCTCKCLTCKMFKILKKSFAYILGDFTEMSRFQLSNEKSDLATWGPYSHMATLAAPVEWACDLPFATAPMQPRPNTEVGAHCRCFPRLLCCFLNSGLISLVCALQTWSMWPPCGWREGILLNSQ